MFRALEVSRWWMICEGWREKRDLAFLCCCSGSVARTELAWSRRSVNMHWTSGCWNATGQVLLGGWHPTSHLISTKQWNLASIKQMKKSVPGEKWSILAEDTHLASNRVGIQTWICADLKPLPFECTALLYSLSRRLFGCKTYTRHTCRLASTPIWKCENCKNSLDQAQNRCSVNVE